MQSVAPSISNKINQKIAAALNLREIQVENTIQLLIDEECTIPFVTRYRKERTGSLDEVQIRDIRDQHLYLTELEKNREKYMKAVETLSTKDPVLAAKWPALKQKFLTCDSKQELEDLYLPFKPKRRTKAQIAKEKGLEPLLRQILEHDGQTALETLAAAFVNADNTSIAPELKVNNPTEAIQGARDILAEEISEKAEVRAAIRDTSFEQGALVAGEADPESTDAEFIKNKEKYKNYFDYREPITAAVGHRIMAVRRGEAEKVLKMNLEVDQDMMIHLIKEKILQPRFSDLVASFVSEACTDSYKRLIAPSIETEIRLALKARGEEEAIKVFAENLGNLLMLPPLPDMVVMGIDPGLRTGSKIAVLDGTGKLLEYATVYPDYRRQDDQKTVQAKQVIVALAKKHNVQCIAIGNGTGSKDIDQLTTRALKEHNMSGIKRAVVNEAGASVYSTDPIARDEFPDLDPTIRSAISIGRRLQDPLAELVKIDPRSIGVGQYQHDVNVTKLAKTLTEVVESCVNRVGVNINTASFKLLSHVSGIGPALAKNIVKRRESAGRFKSRQELAEVSGFGPKAFQQAAGFLRVPGSEHPLDNSAVHPESYDIVARIVKDLNKEMTEIIGKATVLDDIELAAYVDEKTGLPTLKDIVNELKRPGRDPREDGARLLFSDDVSDITDLKVGEILKGTVSNVTKFGAFVDIGVHQDGLIHLSELSEEFIQDASQVVQVGKTVEVRVIDVDLNRRRISLSIKQLKVYNPEQNLSSDPQQQRQPQRPPSRQQSSSSGQGQNQSNQNRPPQHRPSDHRGGGQSQQRPGGDSRSSQRPSADGNRRPPQHQQGQGGGGSNRPYNQGPQGQGQSHGQQQHRQAAKPKTNPPQPSFTLDDLKKKYGKE